ncbi:bifunctional protein HldE [Trichonephila clavipes]|nr:bifunctional protein HldE [Trichonephila clavipes]
MQLLDKHNFQAVLVICGEQGMIIIRQDQPEVYFTAYAKQVYDTGAGDTVITCLALTYAAQANLIQSAQFTNTAASIVVGKLEAATVSLAELRRVIQIPKLSFSEDELKIEVTDAKHMMRKL